MLDAAAVRVYLTVRKYLTIRKDDVDMATTAKTEAEPAPAPAAGGATPPKTSYCSFCFKSQYEVKRLISGPFRIFICDECVDLCNEVIAGRPIDRTKDSPEALPTEHWLERLRPIEETIQGKGNQLQRVVELLRARGVSWAQIGAALGVSRQSAWERFT